MGIFIGTSGSDGLIGSILNDTITGGAGNDLLVGLTGDDILDGGADNDVLDGGIGDDTLLGGEGNDRLVLTAGDDVAIGGKGNDKYYVNGNAGDHVFITDTGGIDTLNFFGAIGGAKIDIRPGALSFVDDRVIELSGLGETTRALELVMIQDRSGSFSDDLSTIAGLLPGLITSVTGLTSDVSLGLASFIDKPISPFGGSGDHEYKTELALTTDTAAWSAAVTGLTASGGSDGPEAQMTALLQVALRTSEVGWSSGSLKVVVLTTDAKPHMAGDNPGTPNNGDTVLDGPGGNGTGEDYPTLEQVKGALLAAGIIPVFAVTSAVTADYEALVADLGFGVVVPLSSNSSDIIKAFEDGISGATETIIENVIGTGFRDTILGNDANNFIRARGGNDFVNGGLGRDRILGGQGNDKILGSRGNDRLEGNDGNDLLSGGAGRDKLTGGAGDDRMNGGGGADLFLFDGTANEGADQISGFADTVDRIQVAGGTVSTIAASGTDTLVTLSGGTTITIVGVDVSLIDLTDFDFV
jgi:Ca2+-binding RTX toxin-like protein